MAGERILIIEHDPRVRERAALILDGLDFTVFEADDARSGLEAFEAEMPELVIVEEALPWVGGLDVCARILTSNPETSILLLSAGPLDSPVLNEARASYGIGNILLKPISEQSLRAAVFRAFGVVPTIDAATAMVGTVEEVSEPPPPRRPFAPSVPIATEMFFTDSALLTADVELVDSLSDDEVDSSFFHDVDPPSGTSLRAERPATEPPASTLTDEPAIPAAARSEDEGQFQLRPMAPGGPTEPQGIYGPLLLGDLLYNTFRDIFTGNLILKRGSVTKTITLRNGFPIAAESNVRSEELGWRLRLDGVLTESAHRQYRVMVEEQGLSPQQALAELGAIGPAELFELERKLVRERILGCFDWTDARYGLTYDPAVANRVTAFEVNPLVVIFEGIKRSFPIAPMVTHFDSHGARPVRRTEKLRDYARLLRDFADELRLAESCDGNLTVGQLISQSPFGLIDTLRILRALEIMQCVVFERGEAAPMGRPSVGMAPIRDRSTLPGQPATPSAGTTSAGPRPTRPSLPPRPAPPSATAHPPSAPGSRSTGTGGHAAVAPRDSVITASGQQPAFRPVTTGTFSSDGARRDTGPSAPSGLDDALRQVINEKFQNLSVSNHYQMLDIMPAATPDAVRSAFMRMARLCHPDQLGAGADDELRRRAGEVQRRIAVVWETLSDARKRAEYDALHVDIPGDDGKPDIMKAESNFQKGRTCLAKGENKRALDFLDLAARQDAHQALYRVHRGWARFLCAEANDSRSRNEAREEIKAALTEDEAIDAGYLFMGNISKVLGNDDLAERFYRKTLALNPSNADAIRELRLLDTRRRDKGKDGLLNKFFKK